MTPIRMITPFERKHVIIYEKLNIRVKCDTANEAVSCFYKELANHPAFLDSDEVRIIYKWM